MKKKIALMITLVMLLVTVLSVTSFAADANVTAYAYADIAGTINGTTIEVNVPYSTVTTYWNHKVDISDGATFTAGAIKQISDKHSQGEITVTAQDGTRKVYTVNIRKNDFVAPKYSVSKAKSIKKNSAKVVVTLTKNDAQIQQVRVVFYTKKNQLSYRQANKDNEEQDIELTGLQSGTKYYYYLEVQTTDKTYTTSAQSFTTKREADSGTSSQSSSNKNSSSSNNTNRGTNSTGTGTTAKNNTQKKNEWSFENGKWYYYGEDGFSKVGWFQVGTKWYYTVKGTNELLMNCWKNIGGSYYCFDPSGAMYANQWVLSNGKWYWMGSSGTMLCDQNIDVGGVTYLLAPDGTCVTDEWVMKDGQWQYYKPASAGLARNENFIYDGKTYYADANGFVR